MKYYQHSISFYSFDKKCLNSCSNHITFDYRHYSVFANLRTITGDLWPREKKKIFLFAYHLISLAFLISLIARGFLFYGKMWVASKYTSGSKVRHEENEGACAALTVKLWAKQTLHFIIVKVHKACSGFMKSASCWQVLFWQSWENCLTKR